MIEAQHDQLTPPSSLPSNRLFFSAQDHWADRTFDGVGVEVNAAIVEKAYQSIPVVQRIVDRVRGGAAGRQFRQLRLEPPTQVFDERPTLSLAHHPPGIRGVAANARLDLVECRDAPERLGGDRRGVGLGKVVEAAPHMAPAENQRHLLLITYGTSELLVSRIAVALQDAAIAAEQRVGVDMSATRRVAVDDGRRRAAAPRPIAARRPLR